jgi:hypothetical protein
MLIAINLNISLPIKIRGEVLKWKIKIMEVLRDQLKVLCVLRMLIMVQHRYVRDLRMGPGSVLMLQENAM